MLGPHMSTKGKFWATAARQTPALRPDMPLVNTGPTVPKAFLFFLILGLVFAGMVGWANHRLDGALGNMGMFGLFALAGYAVGHSRRAK